MLFKLFGFDATVDIVFIKQFYYVLLVGIFLNLIFSYFLNQRWLANFNSYIISSLIIISVFTITKVISNNIALSLGLVGALSIVRFRTPIKNPVELGYYFLLITFGITANVNLNLSLNFLIFIFTILVIVKLAFYIAEKLNLSDFNLNNEKNYFLLLKLSNKNEDLENSNLLINLIKHTNGEYTFQLTSKNKNELLEIVNSYKNNELISFEITKASDFEGIF